MVFAIKRYFLAILLAIFYISGCIIISSCSPKPETETTSTTTDSSSTDSTPTPTTTSNDSTERKPPSSDSDSPSPSPTSTQSDLGPTTDFFPAKDEEPVVKDGTTGNPTTLDEVLFESEEVTYTILKKRHGNISTRKIVYVNAAKEMFTLLERHEECVSLTTQDFNNIQKIGIMKNGNIDSLLCSNYIFAWGLDAFKPDCDPGNYAITGDHDLEVLDMNSPAARRYQSVPCLFLPSRPVPN